MGCPGSGALRGPDELFPSIRTFIVVDKQVAAISYPGRDGAFGFTLPQGEYVLKAFFGGKAVGKPMPLAAKDKSSTELKDPLNLVDGAKRNDDCLASGTSSSRC